MSQAYWATPRSVRAASMRREQSFERRERQKQSVRLSRERLEPVTHVQHSATLDLTWVPAIQDVEHHNSNPQVASCAPDALKRIDKQVTAIAFTLEAGIHTYHGDKGRRYLSVSRSRPAKAGRQIAIIDRMRVQRIIANKIAAHVCHNEDPQVAGLREFVGSLAQIIIDLSDPACEAHTVMARWVERFDPHHWRRQFCAHWLEIVR
jgi:hypothetical protein